MDYYKQIGSYFFIIGALLAVLAGAFPLASWVAAALPAVLIFLGVFSAILNIDDDEEQPFLLAGAAFVIVIVGLRALLGSNLLVAALARFFEAVMLFVGSMVAVVALKLVAEFGNVGGEDNLQSADEALEHAASFLADKKKRTWHFVVFLAVAVSFIVILLDVFFSFAQYLTFFLVVDILITVVFLIDLVVLYRHEKSWKNFWKHCWLDVVATIPFYNIFRVAKLLRLFRLMRILKLNKTLKFFSEESGVKHYLRQSRKKKK